VTQALLPYRVPLMIEKPLGANLQQARALVAAVEAAGVPVMVSLNRRFDPGLRLALHWIGERGPIRQVHGVMRRCRRLEPTFLWDTGIHLLDALHFVAGPLSLISQHAPAGPGACWCTAHLAGERGLAATVEIAPACGREEEHLSLTGDGWSVDAWTGSPHPWRVRAFHDGRCVLDAAAGDEADYLRCGSYAETASFIDALLQGHARFSPTPAEALPASELTALLQEGEHASVPPGTATLPSSPARP
jgi:predicted dehydrogenase